MGERANNIDVPLRVQNRIVRAVRAKIIADEPLLRHARDMRDAAEAALAYLDGKDPGARLAARRLRRALRKSSGGA